MIDKKEQEFKMVGSRIAQIALLASTALCFVFTAVSWLGGAPPMAFWWLITCGVILSLIAAYNWSVIKACENCGANS